MVISTWKQGKTIGRCEISLLQWCQWSQGNSKHPPAHSQTIPCNPDKQNRKSAVQEAVPLVRHQYKHSYVSKVYSHALTKYYHCLFAQHISCSHLLVKPWQASGETAQFICLQKKRKSKQKANMTTKGNKDNSISEIAACLSLPNCAIHHRSALFNKPSGY